MAVGKENLDSRLLFTAVLSKCYTPQFIVPIKWKDAARIIIHRANYVLLIYYKNHGLDSLGFCEISGGI